MRKYSAWCFSCGDQTQDKMLCKTWKIVERVFGQEGKFSWNAVNLGRAVCAEDGIVAIIGGMMAILGFSDSSGPSGWIHFLDIGSGRKRRERARSMRDVVSKLLKNNNECWSDLGKLLDWEKNKNLESAPKGKCLGGKRILSAKARQRKKSTVSLKKSPSKTKGDQRKAQIS